MYSSTIARGETKSKFSTKSIRLPNCAPKAFSAVLRSSMLSSTRLPESSAMISAPHGLGATRAFTAAQLVSSKKGWRLKSPSPSRSAGSLRRIFWRKSLPVGERCAR